MKRLEQCTKHSKHSKSVYNTYHNTKTLMDILANPVTKTVKEWKKCPVIPTALGENGSFDLFR